ncbi:CGNR zinc finger domain-containing protein [Streptomyces sp. NBC_01591]|uniref:CGNR zinc finger domain-containing protein n=1 Tax=Streptomyces sp. NBC_01591 TaxID=2975888 RepID=UPI002DD930BE|nr:CGNR zinc finger domain-containing protein [Streptomyces sp. NBC_01591]WSD66332.1 CGNR zinc finger domain-containing protein [Streptomyces sp. NBC_01591]
MTEDLTGANPRGLHFIAELANTVQDGTQMSAADFQALLERHSGPSFALTESDARRLREATARLIHILAMHDEDQAAEAINTLLDQHPAQPYLVRLPGRPWSLHTRAPQNADPTHWLLSTTALALGLWLSERGRCAWGQCAAPNCNHYFIDTGRRTPQRYCTPRCATRVRVASHRAQRGR